MAVLFLMLACVPLSAQERRLNCGDGGRFGDRDGYRHCEMKEWTIPAGGRVAVDAGQNGGVAVYGSDRGDVLVRAKVETNAPTEADAKAMVGQINFRTAGGQIRADGPDFGDKRWFAVSYEVFVPRRTDLNLKAHNGGIRIADVTGGIEFSTTNGGVSLSGLAGTVKGSTTNGGLDVKLAGNRWDGSGLEARTTNGGVSLTVPENYSARLETGTVNGGMKLDIPVTLRGEISKQISVDIGSGGPPVRVTTTNGGVRVKRAG